MYSYFCQFPSGCWGGRPFDYESGPTGAEVSDDGRRSERSFE